MDIHQAIQAHLTHTTVALAWPELRSFITGACAQRDRNWLLPVLAGHALGAVPIDLVPAAAAIACLQLHLLAIDDMLDADPRGLHQQLGMPATANLASALAALGIDALCRSDYGPEAKQTAITCLAEMCLRTSYGQHLDALNPDSEVSYWAAVGAKSAPFFAAAFHIGAVMAGADSGIASQMRALGSLYGEIIQVFDDVHDSMAHPANPDWSQGRSPLPILFAQTVPHPHRERFLEIRPAVADPAMLAAAQDILIRCGAVSYCIDQIVVRHRQAARLLKALPLRHRAGLDSLLDEIIRPVNCLLNISQG